MAATTRLLLLLTALMLSWHPLVRGWSLHECMMCKSHHGLGPLVGGAGGLGRGGSARVTSCNPNASSLKTMRSSGKSQRHRIRLHILDSSRWAFPISPPRSSSSSSFEGLGSLRPQPRTGLRLQVRRGQPVARHRHCRVSSSSASAPPSSSSDGIDGTDAWSEEGVVAGPSLEELQQEEEVWGQQNAAALRQRMEGGALLPGGEGGGGGVPRHPLGAVPATAGADGSSPGARPFPAHSHAGATAPAGLGSRGGGGELSEDPAVMRTLGYEASAARPDASSDDGGAGALEQAVVRLREAAGRPNPVFTKWLHAHRRSAAAAAEVAPQLRRMPCLIVGPDLTTPMMPGCRCNTTYVKEEVQATLVEAALHFEGLFGLFFVQFESSKLMPIGVLAQLEDIVATPHGFNCVHRLLARLRLRHVGDSQRFDDVRTRVADAELVEDDTSLPSNCSDPSLSNLMMKQALQVVDMFDNANRWERETALRLGSKRRHDFLFNTRPPLQPQLDDAMNSLFERPSVDEIVQLSSFMAMQNHFDVASKYEALRITDCKKRLQLVWSSLFKVSERVKADWKATEHLLSGKGGAATGPSSGGGAAAAGMRTWEDEFEPSFPYLCTVIPSHAYHASLGTPIPIDQQRSDLS
eukprot:GHVU01025260.1.p1 GENE.GHVU01025260.1~~GHVU01025260.1.p1  ORF type:complete len:636 (-),score=115.50 GHVU01025260.1:67-1974(-)